MITVEEAQELTQKHLPQWKPWALARAIYSDRNYPPYHRVMMDGIAISFDAYQNGRREFLIKGICPAGEPQKILTSPESCLEVMTGAPLPDGADLVIQYEHLELDSSKATVTTKVSRTRFENVHLEGSDCKRGDLVLPGNSFWNGPHAGITASMGISKHEFSPNPRIMIISTGDELVEVDDTPDDHQIRRSNVYAIKASLELNGYTDIVIDHLKDDPSVIAQHYEKFATNRDMLIYSGGVSKGKYDYLPNIWADLGVTRHFHEVRQRPGKPLWFGTDYARQTTVIGLPGNPVSSLMCLHRYFIPSRVMYATLTENMVTKKDLTTFVPVQISFTNDGVILASPLKMKNSGEFSALAGSDGFLELPSRRLFLWKTLQ
jgi:molybdopterin molybdotransferase